MLTKSGEKMGVFVEIFFLGEIEPMVEKTLKLEFGARVCDRAPDAVGDLFVITELPFRSSFEKAFVRD